MDKLKKLRNRIDWLDEQIASLLNERMMATDEVGKIKITTEKEVTDQCREADVLERVKSKIQHPILKANIFNIYREIMQESRTAQQFFRHPSQPFRRIGIIGLGLIGGSICKAIKTKDASIQISTLLHLSEDDALARQEGWIDQVYPALTDLIQNCELIILATPISSIKELAEKIKSHAGTSKKCIVIDIASVKGSIVKTFEQLTCGEIEFLGTHPMAGIEKNGFANSQATLFVNRPWVVVPHKKNNERAIGSINELIQFLGSEPILLEAEKHDHQAALISHLPMIIAKSYLDFVKAMDPKSVKIAGPGFQSFTRLGHKCPQMRDEITETNLDAIENYLSQWLEYIKQRQS